MKMYIGGAERDSSDGKLIEVINPATNEVIDTIPSATKEDIDEVLSNAKKGEKEWAVTPLHARMAIMQKFVDLAMREDNRKEMALIMSKEMGKPYKEAYGDFMILKNHIEGFISAARNNLTGNSLPIGGEAGKELDFDITIRQPIGTIVCIIAFNAPLTLFAKKVAPALLTGNCAIVKPATDDPLTILMLSRLMLEAGVPGNAYQCVTGRGETTGDLLVGDKRIAGVDFTGSTDVGVRIGELCGRNLKFQSLEMGGNAPLIICADADIAYAVNEAAAGRGMYLSGQICSVAKRFLVHRSIHDQFVEALAAKLSTVKVGDPMDPETQMGTLISEKAAKKVEDQVNLTIEQGAKLVMGNQRNGAFYGPTVLDHVDRTMDIAHDMEVFGPVFPIISFDTIEEAIEIANDTKYGLGSGIITKDLSLAMKAALQLEAGNVVVNGQTFYRNLLTPFGGAKESGVGREGQTATLLAMTEIKNIVFKNILK
jgi:succinate-semialdehyde dehydrogenase/glutarate-semialdehyde dehydrogenase